MGVTNYCLSEYSDKTSKPNGNGQTVMVMDKDQTSTPGTPRPTLCDKCVGSLTSHRVMNIEVL